MKRLTLVIALTCLAPLAPAAVIHDQTFTPSSWDLVNGGGNNVSSMSTSQQLNNGVTGNTQVTTTLGSSPLTYQAEHYKNDAPWTPAVDGPIDTISWQLWYQVSNGSNTYGVLKLVARQGTGPSATYYVANSTYTEPALFSSNWQKAQSGNPLHPADFVAFRGPGPSTLDFSPAAAPIYFGYMNFSPVNLFTSRVDYRTSFFDLNITPLPEPASLALATLPVLALAARHSRRPQ